jgi:hypothetical protein
MIHDEAMKTTLYILSTQAEISRASSSPRSTAPKKAAPDPSQLKPLKNRINRIKPHKNHLTLSVSRLGSATNYLNHLFEEKTEVQPDNNNRAAQSDHRAGETKTPTERIKNG